MSDWAGRFWYSFYERGAIMDDFCQRALAYMTSRPLAEFKKRKTAEMKDDLIAELHARPWLLILDGLERVLVAAGATGNAAAVDSERATPILMCTSLSEAVALFRDELGFTVAFEWGDPPDFAGVCLDRTQVFLCEGNQGQSGTWLMIWVDDVDAFHAGLSLERAEILEGPVDRPWGTRELLVRVHDEHVLRFGGPLT